MVANVDPFAHRSRYGHDPVVTVDGVRYPHRGDGSFGLPIVRAVTALMVLMAAGCMDLTRFDYLEVEPHPEQQLVVDKFNEYYGETLDPTGVTWVDADYGLWVDDTGGFMPGERVEGFFIDRGFGGDADDCGEIYVVYRGADMDHFTLIHELHHCYLLKNYGDPEFVPKGYQPPEGTIAPPGHENEIWHDGDGVHEATEINNMVLEARKAMNR